MPETTSCPVSDCSFAASVSDIVSHVEEAHSEDHSWESLGYENSDEFRLKAHLQIGEQLERLGNEKHDVGEFESAIDQLERAIWHYQQARLVSPESKMPLKKKCRAVHSTIDEVKQDVQIQEVDDLLDEAELTSEEANPTGLKFDPSSAAETYRRSIDTLRKALTKAETVVPDRIPEIQRRLRRVRLLQQSIDLSGQHKELRELVMMAREYASEGDRSFKQDDFERAVEQYTAASQCYESIEELFQNFIFDEPTDDPTVCDVCHGRFEQKLLYWGIDGNAQLKVCPSCAQFSSDGTLPTPKEAQEEHQVVKENIESICEGDTGVDWTAVPQPYSKEPSNTERASSGRNTQQMLMQLTGTVQRLGRLPTAEDLDEYTDFGYLEYRDEFGSILKAVKEAGFEVSE
ncbi:homing endonuclease associated repeat-containing protein [Haloferax sp. DFSO52]|uniref:homing endonuclease associated repeat-containing protein n=1 Tax=Haloferax sp. DFSO52 TaxID=3388505 RepID=UPI003A88B2E1